MKEIFRHLFHLIYPDLCLACKANEPLINQRLCLLCLNSLPFIKSSQDSRAALEGKEFFPESVQFYHALFYYTKDGKVADMVHRLKYNGQYRIGNYLGTLLGKRLNADDWKNYLIAPVPIHPKRYQKRGFNQAEEIAKGISKTLGIPCCGNYLLRVKHESSQTGKDKYSRSKALSSAFTRNEKYKEADKVILVDDVVTTGSTIKACVAELEKGMKKEIAVLSLGVSI